MKLQESRKFPVSSIHLGAHRTGSTLLQLRLDDKREELNGFGVDALTPPRPGKREVKTLRNVFRDYCNYCRRYSWMGPVGDIIIRRGTGRFRDDILRLSREKTTRLILSDENFLGPVIRPKKKPGCYPEVEKYMSILAKLVDGKSDRIFLACRPYDSFIISVYLMQYIYDNGKYEFSDFKKEVLSEYFSWVNVVNAIRNSFSDTPITIWSRMNDSHIDRFILLSGISEAENWLFENSSSTNMAPTQSAMEAYRRLSLKHKINHSERDQISLEHSYGPSVETGIMLSDTERELLGARYDRDMREIASFVDVEVK